jgi:hypothetical protein
MRLRSACGPIARTLCLVALGAVGAVLAPPPAAAVLVYTRDSAACNHPVVAAANDGRHAHVVASGRFPQVAPDGRRVVFVRCTSRHEDDLYVAPIAGGPARLLAHDVDLPDDWGPHSWSADSGSVLVLDAAEGRVLVVDVRRARLRTLRLKPGVRLNGASFSPDGADIVLDEIDAGGERDSFVLATRGGTRRLSAFGHEARRPVWGPAGLAAEEADASADSVQLRSSATAPPRAILLGGEGENLEPVAWSGDGRVLLVVSVTLGLGLGQSGLPATKAILITPSTAASVTIAGYAEFYDVSADGLSVLARQGRDVVSVTGAGVAVTLAASAQSASWSRRP